MINACSTADPIPGVDCKEEFINLCVKAKTEPCPLKGQTQAKNCGTYLVYQLIKLPGMARFCFGSESIYFYRSFLKPIFLNN